VTRTSPNYVFHITIAVCNLVISAFVETFNSIMSPNNINYGLWILLILTSQFLDPSHSVKISSCDVRDDQSLNGLHLDCSNRHMKEIPTPLDNISVVSVDLSRNLFKVSILCVPVPSNSE